MSSKSFHATRFENGQIRECEDPLTVERPLQIKINSRPFSVTMRSPGDDQHLVKGLLYTEGIVNPDAGDYTCTEECLADSREIIAVNVEVPEAYLCDSAFDKRSLLANASCGLCGQRELDLEELGVQVLQPRESLALDRVTELMGAMRDAQQTFNRTGSTHAAAVFGWDYKLICLYEDIGRHNAVDKAIGRLIESRRLDEAEILCVSGRVSFEIVIKAYRARIPFLLAVSAPSSFAVEMSELWGISVLGYCREQRATVYSHAENVKV
jgi:FdhD protein